MKTKMLNCILQLTDDGGGRVKRIFTEYGTGKSNDDAQEKCWKNLKAKIRKEYGNTIRFRVRMLHFENV